MTHFITKSPAQTRREAVRDAFDAVPGAAGFSSRKLEDGGERIGYDIVDLTTGESVPLARQKEKLPADWPGGPEHGHFSFSAAGFAFGEAIIERALAAGATALFLDEIGKLEIGGGGFAPLLERLAAEKRELYLGCRKVNIKPLTERFGL